MFHTISLPGSWGPVTVHLPPPLITDETLAQAKVTDLRAQLMSMLLAAKARQEPTTRPLVRLLEHIHREILRLSAGGQLGSVPAKKLDAAQANWQALERLTTLCLQQASPKISPNDPEVVELVRRWLSLQMQALERHEQAHELDGHPVQAGIIKDKRLVQSQRPRV